MDSSRNTVPISLQQFELQTRRLRLISDMMEDYQENMRRAMRLIGCELFVSNNLAEGTNIQRMNVDDWIDNTSQNGINRYSSETPRVDRHMDPPYSFNRSPPSLPQVRSSMRRGFIYTQTADPPLQRDRHISVGIDTDQIAEYTDLIEYDASMNESRCPITLDSFEPGQMVLQVRACGHIFGQEALTHWVRRNSVCPVCRTSIIQSDSEETTASTNALNQIISGILSGVNGAMNTESGHSESEITFDVSDLLNSYTELLQGQSQNSLRNSTLSTSR